MCVTFVTKTGSFPSSLLVPSLSAISNSWLYFRSVNYNRVQRRCLLLTRDRLTGGQSGGKLAQSGDMDYLENTCLARHTGVCDFKPRMGLLLKTVDSVQGSTSHFFGVFTDRFFSFPGYKTKF